MQARYQSPTRGQFLSEDPMFWETGVTEIGRSILKDPQFLNSYSYAANNPITGKDADGRLVELVSRPVEGAVGAVGAHSFVAIVPDNPKSIGLIPGVNTSRPFTMGGYTDAPAQYNLYKQANEKTDYSYAFGTNTYGGAQVIVDPPAGVSQQDFEAGIVNSYNSLPATISENGYGFLGQRRISNNPNSNNAATSILLGAGVSSSQINNYQSQLFAQNFRITPGLGTSISASTYGQSLNSTLTALRGALTQLLSVISKK
jgi:RHS repeat-associated protein